MSAITAIYDPVRFLSFHRCVKKSDVGTTKSVGYVLDGLGLLRAYEERLYSIEDLLSRENATSEFYSNKAGDCAELARYNNGAGVEFAAGVLAEDAMSDKRVASTEVDVAVLRAGIILYFISCFCAVVYTIGAFIGEYSRGVLRMLHADAVLHSLAVTSVLILTLYHSALIYAFGGIPNSPVNLITAYSLLFLFEIVLGRSRRDRKSDPHIPWIDTYWNTSALVFVVCTAVVVLAAYGAWSRDGVIAGLILSSHAEAPNIAMFAVSLLVSFIASYGKHRRAKKDLGI